MSLDYCISSGDENICLFHLEPALAINQGLIDLGYSTSLDHSNYNIANNNIMFNGHRLSNNFIIKNNTIAYNLEQLYERCIYLTPRYLEVLSNCKVYDYNISNINFLKDFGIEAKHLPIGYHPILETVKHQEKTIDICFVGSLSDRRVKILQKLQDKGYTVAICNNLWGFQRDNIFAKSKIVLNLHYYSDIHLFEVVRVSYLLANKIFVVSETGQDSSEKEFQEGVAFADYDQIIDTCEYYLNHQDEANTIASRGYEIFKKMDIRDYLRTLFGSPEPIGHSVRP